MNVWKRRRGSRESEARPGDERLSRWGPVEVECYSGYRAEETPRVVVLSGKRVEVAEVLSRERLRDKATGRTVELFRCRFTDGRALLLEKSEEGAWRARVPRASSPARLKDHERVPIHGRENRGRRIISR
jgi:hypothetical protein